MATCPNCKTKLSCGCQKRTTSDGKIACSKCIGAYEKTAKQSLSFNTNKSSSVQDRFSQFANKFKL